MIKTTKPRNDWKAIELDYLAGMTLNDLTMKYKIDKSNITRQARKKGWMPHNAVGKTLTAVTNAIKINHPELDKEIEHLPEFSEVEKITVGTGITKEDIKNDVYRRLVIQNLAFANNNKAYDLMNQYFGIIGNNLAKSPDGLYTKSIGQGGAVTYGSYADDIAKVIVPMITENNKALGMTTAQVAIQNNFGDNGNNGDDKPDNRVIINVSGE